MAVSVVTCPQVMGKRLLSKFWSLIPVVDGEMKSR